MTRLPDTCSLMGQQHRHVDRPHRYLVPQTYTGDGNWSNYVWKRKVLPSGAYIMLDMGPRIRRRSVNVRKSTSCCARPRHHLAGQSATH
jgi:hypothetical protein